MVSKRRCLVLDRLVVARPGKDVAEKIKAWLTDGAEVPAPQVTVPAAKPQPVAVGPATSPNGHSTTLDKRMWAMIREHKLPVEDTAEGTFVTFGGKRFRPKALTEDQVGRFVDSMRAEFEGV